MVHPSYQLNPGDMFQVDVEKVLYGTGEQKITGEAEHYRRRLAKTAAREEKAQEALILDRPSGSKSEEGSEASASGENAEAEAAAEAPEVVETDALSAEENLALRQQILQSLLVDVKMVLRDKNADGLTAKVKTKLRAFRKSAAKFLSHPEDSEIDSQELIEELQLQMKTLQIESEPTKGTEEQQDDEKPKLNLKRMIDRALDLEGLDDKQKAKAIELIGYKDLSKDEMRKLGRLLKEEEENPVDDSKPYATPWRPKPFMRAFAFIPRYLEVNPNICAAVYLRHPVARKGLGEVPTPFPYFTNQLAHNWYLGRG